MVLSAPARSVASFRRLGRGLGLAPIQILTQIDSKPKSDEKSLISCKIRDFVVETTELEFNFSSDKVYQNISACAVVFAANGS